VSAESVTVCQHCGEESSLISQALGLCLGCIRSDFEQVLPLVEKVHSQARKPFDDLEMPAESAAYIRVGELTTTLCDIGGKF